MSKSLNIIIPLAGQGSRLRPLTWSRPKSLISVGGKTVIGHILDILENPKSKTIATKYIFAIGYLGEQIENYINQEFPYLNSSFIKVPKLLGQSFSILAAMRGLSGPTLIIFSDTITKIDISSLQHIKGDGGIWVKQVKNPERFGTVEIDSARIIKNVVEKSQNPRSNLALVGAYFFNEGRDLIDALENQISRMEKNKGEYYLADAIKELIINKNMFTAIYADYWIDAGVPETLLEANRQLLRIDSSSISNINRKSVVIRNPVYIHPSAKITNSTIGPNVSVGASCSIDMCQITESNIGKFSILSNCKLQESIIGNRCEVSSFSGNLLVGDDSKIYSTEN